MIVNETAKRLLMVFTLFDLGGQDIAVKSADNFRFLRKKGVTVRKTIDIIIATFCIENNFPLLHSDKDFLPFQEHLKLQIVH